MNTKLNIESIIDGSIEKVKLAESVQESLNKIESKTDIVASQIFLEFYTDFDDFQIFSHKSGYEEHNREVCQRLIENCFSDKASNNEMFFVTINGLQEGVPYMETAILESNTEEVVRASFVKGSVAQSSSIAASIGILSIDVENLRYFAETGEDRFNWRYISTLVPSIDAIDSGAESDIYVTEFTFEQITTNGTTVNVSPELVNAIYNKRVIVIPSRSGQSYIATNVFSGTPLKNVSIQMQIVSGTYIYDVTLNSSGTAPQTVPTRVNITRLLSGTLNTINGASIATGADMQLVSSISLNGSTYSPTEGTVDLGTLVKGVTVNGSTKSPSNGIVDLGTVITSHQILKTINGESIVGRGDITISGGSGGNGAYSEVNHGTSDTTFTLTPNTFHIWDEVASLTLDLGSETAGVANEFLFQFTSGATATSLTLPDDIKWANDFAPTIVENMIYQVSILKGLASVLEFDNTPDITLIDFTIDSRSFNAESGMLWSEWVASDYNTSGYVTITQNKVTNLYTSGNLFTTSGVTVNSSDVVQPIKYTFTNPWA